MTEQIVPPVQSVVTEVRKLLLESEVGEIRAIAAVVVRSGGVVSRVVAHPAGEHTNDLAAGIGDLFHGVHSDREALFMPVDPEDTGGA